MLTINTASGRITDGKVTTKLSRKRMDLFLLLWRHRNNVVHHDVILNHLYEHYVIEPEPDVIKVMIFKMRRLLAPLGMEINNIFGVGYELVVPAYHTEYQMIPGVMLKDTIDAE